MKAENYFKHLFGDKANWVDTVDVPVKKSIYKLALILYSLAASKTQIEFGKRMNDLITIRNEATQAPAFWLPLNDNGFLICDSLAVALLDRLGDDAPLSALNDIKIGHNYLYQRYNSNMGAWECPYNMGDKPNDIVTISGDHLRALVDLFK
jgi:hypothetical protein